MTTAPPRPRAAGGAARSPSAVRRPRPADPAGTLGVRRLKIGRLALVLVLAIATSKLVVVQTVQAGDLRAASQRQSTTNIRLPAARGAILDRDGDPLAFSVDARALVTSPRLITQTRGADVARYRAEMADAVAQATGQDRNALLQQLSSDRGYIVLARLVDPEIARKLAERFPEIAEEQREDRQYPGGTLAANVLGAATWDAEGRKLTGRVGLESSQDNLLAGFEGLRVVDTAEDSNAVIPGSTRFERAAVQGSDLQLTLDSDLQFTVQQALTEYVQRTGAAPTSSAVVLDARTAEVLAMAGGQTFDPRDLSAATPEQLRNSAVQGTFEPGSVNKVVTMAGALEYGVAAPNDILTVPGSIRVADRTIGDSWQHGIEQYTLTGVLAKSSNVGTIMTAQKLGEERFAQMLARFGLGERTGVGLPGEEPGQVPPRESWSGSTFGNLPIGQGLTVTTLQMAGVLQTVANDGLRVPPRIVAGTTGPDGVRVAPPPPEPVRVISPETARTLRTMLTAVTQDVRGQRGTGYQAAVPGYVIAGKTGTAQQVDPACGCYSSALHWINFAGMLPAENPRFVIAIMLDAPDPGTSAAPLFHDIATYLAQRERLPVSAAPPPVQLLELP
jgi:cell division protein FtsI (penicillin-binding protein 3)